MSACSGCWPAWNFSSGRSGLTWASTPAGKTRPLSRRSASFPKRDPMSETTTRRLQDLRRLPFVDLLWQGLLSNPTRYLSLVDQGMVALCRFAAIVVFARLLSPDEFGAIALAMSIAILFVGFARATFSLPFAAFCSDHRRLAEDGSKWFTFILFLVAISRPGTE